MIAEAFEPGSLFALKFRGPLFEKCANPFVAIFRKIATNLFPDFIVEGPGEFFFLARKKSLLDRSDSQRWALRDFLRQRLHFRFELRSRYNLADEAEAQRGLRVDHFPGVEKLRGTDRREDRAAPRPRQ